MKVNLHPGFAWPCLVRVWVNPRESVGLRVGRDGKSRVDAWCGGLAEKTLDVKA